MSTVEPSMTELEKRWLELNLDLDHLCSEIIGRLPTPAFDDRGAALRVFQGFLQKAQRTLRAVNLLAVAQLWEQAEGLARVLFELRVSFDFFVEMFRYDPPGAPQRVFDAMFLEKFRQAEAQGLFGESHDIDRGDWEKVVAAIRRRYSPEEFGKLKRHGFSGMSLEQRAKLTGHLEAYQIVYRNFSRNIHSTDYLEHIGPGVIPDDQHASYVRERNFVILYIAYMSAAGIAEQVNALFQCRLEETVEELAQRHVALKQAGGGGKSRS